MNTSNVIGIRFQQLGKLYHFTLDGNDEEIEPGDHVVVETRRGRQLGQVIAYVDPNDTKGRRTRAIDRKANPRDLIMQQVWNQKNLDALIVCREQAHKLELKDVKFVKAEYSFEGSWISYYYSTENRNLDVNELRRRLSKRLNCRVEMQLIGPRDVAKFLGGYGACNSPRCCSTFLTDFSPVSIKMAKEQGITLSPQEITGMCGRLRCCLVFEYEQYVQARKELPRRGKRVGTPYGVGYVRDVMLMRESVMVAVGEEVHEVFQHEIEPIEELEALKKKAAAGCSKHEGGGCDCGAKHGAAKELVGSDEATLEAGSADDGSNSE